MPDSLRILLILACLAVLGYGTLYVLSVLQPEQTEIVRQIPNERLFE